MGWDDEVVKVRVFSCSVQTIHCSIEVMGYNCRFVCSFVYCLNSLMEMRDLWRDLVSKASLF